MITRVSSSARIGTRVAELSLLLVRIVLPRGLKFDVAEAA